MGSGGVSCWIKLIEQLLQFEAGSNTCATETHVKLMRNPFLDGFV
jgi:hypothetical protein